MVGVAVVGAGNWGRNLVRNFASLDGVELKYVCDLDEKVRKEMLSSYPHARVIGDMDDAFGDAAVCQRCDTKYKLIDDMLQPA